MAAATITALADLFKRRYVAKDLSNMALRRTPLFRVIPKKDDLRSEGIYIPYNYGLPVGYAASFARAQANAAASKVNRWFVQRKKIYGFHTLDMESVYASEGNENAFLELKRKELDEVVKGMGQM